MPKALLLYVSECVYHDGGKFIKEMAQGELLEELYNAAVVCST